MKTLIRDTLTPESQVKQLSALERNEVSYSAQTLARVAGFFYVMLCATAFFALFVHSRIVESGNAEATADNIRESTTLFRFGFMSDVLQATFFLFTALALYVLLKHVNQLVAAALVIIVAISVAIQSLNMLNQYTAIMIATDNSFTEAFGKPGSDALALLFSDMQENGFFIAQMFFGLWLLPLGFLVYRSGYVPKLFGILLAAGCVAFLVDMFAHFLFPSVAANVAQVSGVVTVVAEIPFFLWLLIKGVRTSHV